MDDLRGIDGTCSPQPARGTKPRRASSISLDPEDNIGALQPHCVASAAIMPHQSQSSGSAKSPLLLLRPQELHFVDGKSPPSPPEGCPLLPSQPDLTSSPCLSPLQGWLVNKSDREQRMLGLPDSPGIGGKASIIESQPVGTMPDKDDTSSGNSSWDLVEYDSDAARRCASPKRNEDPVMASQELARGREDRSKAPSPEQQTVEAEPPSPASSIMLGDAPIPEHATSRFAHLNEQLQPIGGLGDNTRSLIRYHRHVSPLPGMARINVGSRAHDRRGRGRVEKQTRLRKRHKG